MLSVKTAVFKIFQLIIQPAKVSIDYLHINRKRPKQIDLPLCGLEPQTIENFCWNVGTLESQINEQVAY